MEFSNVNFPANLKAALLGASNLTQAGDVPVIDVAAIAKQIQQLQEMQQQFEHMKKEFEAITGNRGMEKLLNSTSYNKTRDYIS